MSIIWAEVSKLTFRPIEIRKIKYHPISDVYSAVVKDLGDTDIYEAELQTVDNEKFYLTKFKDSYSFDEVSETGKKENVIRQSMLENLEYASGNRKIKFPLGKLRIGEYNSDLPALLEVDSYSDAYKGVEKYYFYINSVRIENSKLTYSCSFAEKNVIVSPERIVAHHKTVDNFEIYTDKEEDYTIEIPRKKQIKVDLQNERAIVRRIMEVEGMDPDTTDTRELTAIARIMLLSDNPLVAISNYKKYLNTYMPKQKSLKK